MKKVVFLFFMAYVILTQTACAVYAQPGYYVNVRPRPVYIAPPPRPYPNHVWIDGDWVWAGNAYAWHPGYWAAPRPSYRYKSGYWAQTRRGYSWNAGVWIR